MYRAYQPLFPSASRYLQEKWDKSNYQEHRRKVEMAAPVVNTTALPTPLHLQVNLKKMQLEKERQAVQERDNLLHYTRLGGIQQSRGRVDNWNFYCRHSLNWEKRQRDLEQVYWENQRLRKRLEGKKSELAQERWQQDWRGEQLVRKSLARYPCSTRSCQAGMERWRQRTGCSSSPALAGQGSPSASPNRACVPSNGPRTGAIGKVALTSVKGSSTTDADGSLARADLRRAGSLEKPTVEAAVPPTKLPPSLHLWEKLKLYEKNPIPTSKEMGRKPKLPTKHMEPCYGKTKTDGKFDG